MKLQPYLFFNGHAEEAVAFYRTAIGAEVVSLTRFSESPEPPMMSLPAGYERMIMHGSIRVGDTEVMVSDGMCSGATRFDGFAISLTVKDGAEAQRVFAALGDGGEVAMPLGPSFFAAHFGMVKDRYGVHWMVVADLA